MELLTPKEVAAILKTSLWFVYEHAESLGGIKIGKLIRFPKGGLYEHLFSSRELVDRPESEREKSSEGRRVQNGTGRQIGGKGKEGKSNGDKYGLFKALRETLGGPGNKEE
jgi:hypothetical protein